MMLDEIRIKQAIESGQIQGYYDWQDVGVFGVPSFQVKTFSNGVSIETIAPFVIDLGVIDANTLKRIVNNHNRENGCVISLKSYFLVDKSDNIAWVILDYLVPALDNDSIWLKKIAHPIHSLANQNLLDYLNKLELINALKPLVEWPQGFSKFVLDNRPRSRGVGTQLVADRSLPVLMEMLSADYEILPGQTQQNYALFYKDTLSDKVREATLSLRDSIIADCPFLELRSILARFDKRQVENMVDFSTNVNAATQTPLVLFVEMVQGEGILVAKNILPLLPMMPFSLIKDFIGISMDGINDIIDCWIV